MSERTERLSMDRARHVVFYSDTPEFGGHEAMTLRGLRALAKQDHVNLSVIFCSENVRLEENLRTIAGATNRLRLLPIDFRSKTVQTVRTILDVPGVRKIQRLMESEKPDIAVVSQGRIEIGSAGLLAARRAKIRAISYIPMAHTVSVAGRQFGVSVRERINRFFYELPDKFITISESARQMLVKRGAKSEIAVVPNCIERIETNPSMRERFRSLHGFSQQDFVVGILGRITFRQKAQDFALRTIAGYQRELSGFKFLFVGDGRDEEQLRTMIVENNLDKLVGITPWSSRIAEVYGGLDLLLIPSNFEGVPLIMLEAMSCGLRIAATNADGMAEYLAPDWLFPQGDSEQLVKTLIRLKDQEVSDVLQANRRKVAEECDVQRFDERFSTAVLQ